MESYANGSLDMNAYIKSWCKPVLDLPVAKLNVLLTDYVVTKIRPHIMVQGKNKWISI